MVDLTDRSGAFGVTILSDCKYGSDKPDDKTLRLTLCALPVSDHARVMPTRPRRTGDGTNLFTGSRRTRATGVANRLTGRRNV